MKKSSAGIFVKLLIINAAIFVLYKGYQYVTHKDVLPNSQAQVDNLKPTKAVPKEPEIKKTGNSISDEKILENEISTLGQTTQNYLNSGYKMEINQQLTNMFRGLNSRDNLSDSQKNYINKFITVLSQKEKAYFKANTTTTILSTAKPAKKVVVHHAKTDSTSKSKQPVIKPKAKPAASVDTTGKKIKN
ncbi:MAG: hypothetical protein ABIQ31_14390 [Ferruginibacter sp.]